MQHFSCDEILSSYISLPKFIKEKDFKGFCHDSREVTQGQIFLVFTGQNTSGLSYIVDAYKAGAIAFVVSPSLRNLAESYRQDLSKKLGLEGSLELTAYDLQKIEDGMIFYDPAELLDKVSQKIRTLINYRVVGITGTVGKTTFKSFASQLLGQENIFYSKKNWNNAFGLKINLSCAPKTTRAAFFECGISLPGEMSQLHSLLRPTDVVITNIAESHLLYLKTIENVATEKIKLAQGAQRLYITDKTYPVLKDNLAKITARPLVHTDKGRGETPECEIDYRTYQAFKDHLFVNNQKYFRSHLLSSFDDLFILLLSLSNDLGLLPRRKDTDCLQLDFRFEEKRGALRYFSKNIDLLDHSYNCSPESLRSLIRRLSTLDRYDKKVLVVGDVLEQPESILRSFFNQYAADLKKDKVLLYVIGQQYALWPQYAVKVQSLDHVIKLCKSQEKYLIALTASRGFMMEKQIDGLQQKLYS